MRLIRLTKADGGGSLWVDPSRIESIESMGFMGLVQGSRLRLLSGAEWTVNESFDEIEEAIRLNLPRFPSVEHLLS